MPGRGCEDVAAVTQRLTEKSSQANTNSRGRKQLWVNLEQQDMSENRTQLSSTSSTTAAGTWTSKATTQTTALFTPGVNCSPGQSVKSWFNFNFFFSNQFNYSDSVLIKIYVFCEHNSEVYYQLVNCEISGEFENLRSVLENVKCFGSRAKISES